MTDPLRKAAEKVLLNWDYDIDSIQMGEAIESLRQALEQPQEWKTCRHCGFQYRPPKENKWHPLAQPEEKPVAWRNTETGEFCTGGFLRKDFAKWIPLYTAPPKREWVGLVDEEIHGIYKTHHDQYGKCQTGGFEYERTIEAKLKEKNNG